VSAICLPVSQLCVVSDRANVSECLPMLMKSPIGRLFVVNQVLAFFLFSNLFVVVGVVVALLLLLLLLILLLLLLLLLLSLLLLLLLFYLFLYLFFLSGK
jgi:hypothetical protein